MSVLISTLWSHSAMILPSLHRVDREPGDIQVVSGSGRLCELARRDESDEGCYLTPRICDTSAPCAIPPRPTLTSLLITTDVPHGQRSMLGLRLSRPGIAWQRWRT